MTGVSHWTWAKRMAEAQAALRRGLHLRHIQERVRSQLPYLPERASLTPEDADGMSAHTVARSRGQIV
jgi:hypothetical protein